MARLIAIILIFVSGFVFGQDRLIVSGKLSDEDTLVNIKDSKIYFEGDETRFVLSNADGRFTISVPYQEGKKYTLIVKDVRFETYKYPISKKEIKKYVNDTLHLEIKLKFRELGGVTVQAVQEVYGSDKVSVSDFEFVGEENFVMLVYEKRLNKGSTIIYTNAQEKILSSWEILEPAKELFRDFLGNLFLICEKNVYEIHIMDDVLDVIKTDKTFFEEQIKPWVDTVNYKSYYSNYVSFYPAFDYYAFNAIDSSVTKLKTVIDKPLMDLYRAQYKYVDGRDKLEAYRMEKLTGIDKEIWVAIWTGFPNSLYYKALYAPMFVKNDTAMIFDHYKNQIYRYDRNNNLIDSLQINYHLEKDKRDWEELLVQDRNKQRIYSVFLRGGKYYLKELNTTTGEIVKVHQLYYKYPEKLKIKDDYAYYIYRPFESVQNKFLYREKVPK